MSSLHAIDGQDKTLKAIPRQTVASEQDTEHRTLALSKPQSPATAISYSGASKGAGAESDTVPPLKSWQDPLRGGRQTDLT